MSVFSCAPFFRDVLVGVAQRLDVDRSAVERGADRLRQERAVVVGVVPGEAALVMGFFPEGRHELDRVDDLLLVDVDGLAVLLNLGAAPRPQIGVAEGRRVAEGVAERLTDRPARGFELLANLAILLPGVGEGRRADLVEPRFSVGDHGADDSPWQGDPLLAVGRVRFAQIVVAVFGLAHTACEVGQVDDALRIDLRVVVEEHDDVGTCARLNRRGDTRLQVVAIHGLEIDLDSQRLLGGRQQLLAQQLIGSRHEVVPAQPVYGRALCKSGRAAGGQDAGHAAYERGTALEDVTSGYCRHAFLPW